MPTTPEDRRKNYRDAQDFYSSKLSDTTRSMAFGLAAVAFTLLSTDTPFATAVSGKAPWVLIVVAGLACLAVVADALQMLFGWFGTGRAAENEAGDFKADSIAEGWFWWRGVMFYFKIVLAFSAATILVIILAVQVFATKTAT